MNPKRFSLICGVAILTLTIALLGFASAKSLYLASEHHQKLFDAWNINPDGTITKQDTYPLQYATDPAGIAIHNDLKLIFITSEMSGGVEIVDPVTLSYLGVSNGPTNLAGIDVDEANDIVYAVKRETNDLYSFKWDNVGKSLTQINQIDLPNCVGAYGLALDEKRKTLWVADTAAGGIPWDQDIFEVTGLTVPSVQISVNSPGFDVLIYLLDGSGNTIRYSTTLYDVTPEDGTVRFRIVSFGGGTGTYYVGVKPMGAPSLTGTWSGTTESEPNGSFVNRNYFVASADSHVINGETIIHDFPHIIIRGFMGGGAPRPPIVRAYNTDTWEEDISKRFTPSHNPVGIAVDRLRNIVYTVSMSGEAVIPLGTGSTLLSKYDVASKIETTVDMGHPGVGIAVDEVTGYVYITGGASVADNLTVWDTSTIPFMKIQDTGPIGNPAGIVIGNVSYNPLNLAKNDTVQGTGIYIGETFTYKISFTNDNSTSINNVTVVDNLPAELDYVSSSPAGTYESQTHTVLWNFGTLEMGETVNIDLAVKVNNKAQPKSTIYNYCTIDSDETPPTTVIGGDPDDPTGEPGTYLIDKVYVDIHPGSCPNPFNMTKRGVVPTAILGTENFDVTQLDPASVKLCLTSDNAVCISPSMTEFRDAGIPCDGCQDCSCISYSPWYDALGVRHYDDVMDLNLKFDARELALILESAGYKVGDTVSLTVQVKYLDSERELNGQDCMVIVK